MRLQAESKCIAKPGKLKNLLTKKTFIYTLSSVFALFNPLEELNKFQLPRFRIAVGSSERQER
ncbi:MAG: hypothetical protein CMF37_13160 [Leeuwenhoekiella sp.]|nr:hypothetical protein [Leeuwenhoekiella sp.]HBO28532.1 hypothetical protein [Leeuwenhoekiella sp.]